MRFEGKIMNKTPIKTLQQGMALISVLVILLIVTLLGVTAMRMGLSGLMLANNSQVSQLLFQSADMGTVQLTNTINENILDSMDVTGVIGNASGADTHLCLKPTTTGTNFKYFKAGACDPTSSSDYLSKREVVLTQVSYSRRTITDGESSNDLDDISLTGSSISVTGAAEKLKTFSTAVIPSFGTVSASVIKNCLTKTNADDEESDNASAETITDCLTDVGAVFTTHATEYRIQRQ